MVTYRYGVPDGDAPPVVAPEGGGHDVRGDVELHVPHPALVGAHLPLTDTAQRRGRLLYTGTRSEYGVLQERKQMVGVM